MSGRKYKVFISSVQDEFRDERISLEQYLRNDVLLKLYFEPFLFERISATSHSPETVYLENIGEADVYIGLMGKTYGFEDKDGISATENEYIEARRKGLSCWIYILKTIDNRHAKEERFIKRVSSEVSWKFFTETESLIKEVYHSCIVFLKRKGKIEHDDFDSSLHPHANIGDISKTLLREFIEIAREKRNYPERANNSVSDILQRLNLFRKEKIVNSGLLLFSRNPQIYFPSATVKCAHFHGISIQKPIPDYKEFGGTIYEMSDKAVDFILSKISHSTGSRDESNLVKTNYEIPRAAIAEAVINSLVHRDYYSKASVQISVFSNRVEIENPGHLPEEITVEDLKRTHASYPHNPLLANCLFLTGAVERFGTGTNEIVDKVMAEGLAEPVFISHNTFRVILWRKSATPIVSDFEREQVREQVEEQVREQVREQVEEQILLLINQLHGSLSVTELMTSLSLKGRRNFLQNYLQPALEKGIVEMTQPDSPQSPTQRYRLTPKGLSIKRKSRK
jgi:ATP-dependent DNA helicase RecG